MAVGGGAVGDAVGSGEGAEEIGAALGAAEEAAAVADAATTTSVEGLAGDADPPAVPSAAANWLTTTATQSMLSPRPTPTAALPIV